MTHLLEINNLDVKFDTDEGRITAIDNVSGDKTIIVIAHRLSTVKNADRILFLEKGKIEGVVKAQGRDEKISIIKFNRRKHFKKQATGCGVTLGGHTAINCLMKL